MYYRLLIPHHFTVGGTITDNRASNEVEEQNLLALLPAGSAPTTGACALVGPTASAARSSDTTGALARRIQCVALQAKGLVVLWTSQLLGRALLLLLLGLELSAETAPATSPALPSLVVIVLEATSTAASADLVLLLLLLGLLLLLLLLHTVRVLHSAVPAALVEVVAPVVAHAVGLAAVPTVRLRVVLVLVLVAVVVRVAAAVSGVLLVAPAAASSSTGTSNVSAAHAHASTTSASDVGSAAANALVIVVRSGVAVPTALAHLVVPESTLNGPAKLGAVAVVVAQSALMLSHVVGLLAVVQRRRRVHASGHPGGHPSSATRRWVGVAGRVSGVDAAKPAAWSVGQVSGGGSSRVTRRRGRGDPRSVQARPRWCGGGWKGGRGVHLGSAMSRQTPGA